jgi:hypothetical protein
MVEYAVLYDVNIQQEGGEKIISMHQTKIESLAAYGLRSHSEIDAVRKGLTNSIKSVRAGGGFFPMFRNGGYALLLRNAGAKRMPGALDICAGIVEPTSNEIDENMLTTSSKIVLSLSETEIAPVTYDGKKRTYYIFTPYTPQVDEAIAQLLRRTQFAGIERWGGSNPYSIEVNAGVFDLGVAQDSWHVREFGPNGTKVFEKKALVGFEDHSVEVIFPMLYNTDRDPTSFAFVDTEPGNGPTPNRYDNVPYGDYSPPLNRLVVVGGQDGDNTIIVYYNGKRRRIFNTAGEFVRWNPKYEDNIPGYPNSMMELVKDGKSPGMTPKPLAVVEAVKKGNGILFDSLRDDSGKPKPVKVNNSLIELNDELNDILNSKNI